MIHPATPVIPRAPRPRLPAVRRLALLLAIFGTIGTFSTTAAQPPAGAGDGSAQGPPQRILAVGVGTLIQAEAYRGLDEDIDLQPIPLINYEDPLYFVNGPRAGIKLGGADSPWDLRLLVEWDPSGYEEEDGTAFQGMEERRDTIAAGVSIGYGWGARGSGYELGLRVVHDVLDRHGGYEAELRWQAPRRVGAWNLSPSLSLEHRSADMTRHLFGVRPAEARPDRPAYDPEASTDLSLGLQLRRQLQGDWFFFGFLDHTLLDDTVRDSPLVDASSETTGLVGLAYRIF